MKEASLKEHNNRNSNNCSCGNDHAHEHHAHDHQGHNHDHGHDHAHDHGSCCGGHDHSHDQLPGASRTELAGDLSEGEARSVFLIDGMDCGDCARNVERVVGKMEGVREAQVVFSTTKMTVIHTADVPSLVKTVDQIGYRASLVETTLKQPGVDLPGKLSEFMIYGMDCGDCALNVEKRLTKLEGVAEASVNFSTSKLKIRHTCEVESIIRTIDEAGYRAELQGQEASAQPISFWEKHKRTVLTGISGVFTGLGLMFEYGGIFEKWAVPLYVLAILLGGYHTARAGFYSLKSRVMDMNFLMTIAAVGAALIGQWAEGAVVVFLFAVGNWLQAMTMEKTRKSIRSLMDLTPKEALIRRNGKELKLPLTELQINDVVIVRPGERIPMDGIVTLGASTVNQAPITGESIPVSKSTSDEVFAGTINETGSLEFRVTKRVEDTTLSRIIHLVEEAQAQKAPSQMFVDVFAKYYTPTVVAVAVLLAIFPPLFTGDAYSVWIYRALALLVIACPCALVISTPVSIVSAIGNAARNGVLIKGGAFLELMGKIRAMAFDKTGTLTLGKPKVVYVEAFGGQSEQSLLGVAAAIESRSEHPLARAITDEFTKNGDTVAGIENFQAVAGKGAQGAVGGITYRIGKPGWFTELGYAWDSFENKVIKQQELGRTAMLVADESNVIGLIAVADVVREESAATIRLLKQAGIDHTIMLTGDNELTAKAIRAQVGLDEHYGELLPDQKLTRIEQLKERYQRVAMVGDGINDAPALARADIGIAMGGAGTDTALETADIVLMSDDLSKLPFTVRLSRKALAIIKQNIWFSLLVKAVFLVLTVIGISNLWMAVFADTGAAMIVIANGMRLMKSGNAKIVKQVSSSSSKSGMSHSTAA